MQKHNILRVLLWAATVEDGENLRRTGKNVPE
jgi:hypothetical protein